MKLTRRQLRRLIENTIIEEGFLPSMKSIKSWMGMGASKDDVFGASAEQTKKWVEENDESAYYVGQEDGKVFVDLYKKGQEPEDQEIDNNSDVKDKLDKDIKTFYKGS